MSKTAPQFDIDAELARMAAEDEAVKVTLSNTGYAAAASSTAKVEAGFASNPIDIDQSPLLDADQFKDRWANRRRMAWVALIAMIITAALLFFVIEEWRLKMLLDSGIITWFFGVMVSIVGAYMGFTTLHEMGKK